MVHDPTKQEWYHVLCVLLNSARFKFKEISKIQTTEILKINEVSSTDQLTCPSESTFSSSEPEICSICQKSTGK